MQATSYILTYRGGDDPARRANLVTVLGWLALQQLPEVIVVEQDTAPTLGDLAPMPGLVSIFAFNPGPFNKSWGLNVGVRRASGQQLVFGDADTLCRSLPAAVAASQAGLSLVRAFTGLVDLDAERSAMVRDDLSCLSDPGFAEGMGNRTANGERLPLCAGIVIIHRRFLALLGGWDERFQGWGGEDDAMDVKAARAKLRAHRMGTQDGFHLHHRRAEQAVSRDGHYGTNLGLLEQLKTMPEEALRRLCEVSWQAAGNIDRHRPMAPLP